MSIGKQIMNRTALALVAMAVTVTTGASVNGAVVLADEFADVGSAQKSGNTASFGAWDTVTGIDAPATSLSFFDGDDGTTPLSFHDATDGELDVNINMTAGGWDTSITIDLAAGTTSIDLTSLVLDMRLTNGSGGDNSTSSKSGRMIAKLFDGVTTTTVDPGDSSYPSVTYTRTLDLNSLPTLVSGTTYTLTIQARGAGFGHHKSLQALELNGDITSGPVIPAPAALPAGLALMGIMLVARRRSTKLTTGRSA